MKKLSFVLIGCLAFVMASAQNPFLPLWEYIPDGEPFVFEDPDRPGEYRVYVYGSHDSLIKEYCGREQVVWSASVDDLSDWRYDGIIFESRTDAEGKLLYENGQGDVLYAPDIVEVADKDGKKTYYLYPNNQAGGRQTMVAKSDRPDGPFTACNWDPADPRRTVGMFGFDPGVLVDDDGRAYGYWGFEKSFAVELDPLTMSSPKPGAAIVEDLVSNRNQDGVFRFFEASSIRKIEGKYVFVYSRWTAPGEFGLKDTNYTLAYAYSDNPLGPYTYGGTIIDGRGRDTDPDGNAIVTAVPGGNTHGSIVEIKGQWYVFYHRQCGDDEFSRQAMVAPIDVKVEDGKVIISEGEYTSEGFQLNGLDPFRRYSAGIACYYTGPRPASEDYPKKIFSGSYVEAARADLDWKDRDMLNSARNNPELNANPVVNNTDGSIIGYKYFNFDGIGSRRHVDLLVGLTPEGQDGLIEIYVDSPWDSEGGRKIGSIKISSKSQQTRTEVRTRLKNLDGLTGKHALFFKVFSEEKDKSVCILHDLMFE